MKQQEFLRCQDAILRKHGSWAAAAESEADGPTCAERYAETEAADAMHTPATTIPPSALPPPWCQPRPPISTL